MKKNKFTSFLDRHDGTATQIGVIVVILLFLWLGLSGEYETRDEYRGGYGPGYSEY